MWNQDRRNHSSAHNSACIIRKLLSGVESASTLRLCGTMGAYCREIRFTLSAAGTVNSATSRPASFRSHIFMEGEEFRKLIDRTPQFAISTEETRYYLNGIYLHAEVRLAKLVLALSHDAAQAGTCRTFRHQAAPAEKNGPVLLCAQKPLERSKKLLVARKSGFKSELSEKQNPKFAGPLFVADQQTD